MSEEVQPVINALQEIWQKRMKILSLKKVNSITIYLWCEGIEAMAELCLMYKTRHLEQVLGRVFALVTTSVKIPNVMIVVTIAETDLQILEKALQLNELLQNRSQLTEESFPESRGRSLALLYSFNY